MDTTTPPPVTFAWWKRLLILALTVGAVAAIYRRLDPVLFLDTLRGLRPGWLLGAFALYGGLIAAAVGRWHLAMRLTDTVVHFSASVRATLSGHFFSIALFGVGIGDIAKSLVYARWYRFPFPVVFAGAKLDRIVGTLGQALLWVVAFGWSAAAGTFAATPKIAFQLPTARTLLAAGLVVVVGAAALLANRRIREGLIRFWDAFRGGLRRLVAWPRVMAGGVGLGFAVQSGLAFVLALNLAAVADSPLDWSQLLWLFPVIQLIGALPVTVAGLGLREAAAMTLLGLYAVPPEEAAAAALLSFVVAAAWAGIGGLVLARESGRLRNPPSRRTPATISAVVPVLNEAAELPATLRRLKAIPQIAEIIVVDGGSTDRSRDVAAAEGARVLAAPAGRGRQLRLGAQHASGDVVLLVHADTWLPPHAGTAALNCLRDPLVVAGGFWKHFREHPHPLLYGSRWRCGFRLFFGRWIAGDQALFVRREVLETVGGVPDLPLMEEVRLCELLHRHGRLALAGEKVSTSARRFAKFGTLRTLWLMNVLLWRYRRGAAADELRQRYERG